jgi:NADH-quinone oxidoreductase subunit B
MSDSNVMVAPPEGVVGEGFFTKLNDVVGLARANSLWRCLCNLLVVRFMATTSHYDLARFGSERVSFFSSGYVDEEQFQRKWPILRQVYEQMSEPRWVLLLGLCFIRWNFDTYSVLQGIDKVFT